MLPSSFLFRELRGRGRERCEDPEDSQKNWEGGEKGECGWSAGEPRRRQAEEEGDR